MFKQLEPAALQHQLQRLKKVFRANVRGQNTPLKKYFCIPDCLYSKCFQIGQIVLISPDISQHVPKQFKGIMCHVSLVSEAHVIKQDFVFSIACDIQSLPWIFWFEMTRGLKKTLDFGNLFESQGGKCQWWETQKRPTGF